MIFEKTLLDIKYVLIFFTTIVWNISHSTKNSARYYHKCTQVFAENTRYSCSIFIKFGISRQVFENYSNLKFNKNSSNGSRVPCGQTDGRTDRRRTDVMKEAFFRNYAKAPNTNSVRSPHRNQRAFKRKSKRWEMYREIIYVFYKNHNVTNKYTMQTKCRVLSVKPGSIYTNHCALCSYVMSPVRRLQSG